MNSNHLAIIAALFAFTVSSGCYLYAFSSRRFSEIFHKTAYGLFIFATFLVSHISINAMSQGIYNITSGFLLITALAWITLLAQMLFRLKSAGTFVAPIITLITLTHLLLTEGHTPNTGSGPQGLLALHIYSSIIGQAFAILAMAIAVLFLIQQRAMKKKQLGRLLGSSLSLSGLEKALSACLWSGFVFLSTGLVLGATVTQFYGSTDTASTKVIWALAVWTWYLSTLLAKNVFKISAKRVAMMTLVGFGIMAFGFFGLSNK